MCNSNLYSLNACRLNIMSTNALKVGCKHLLLFTTQFCLLLTLREKPCEIMWEKKKMLVTGIFSFFCTMFSAH